MVSGRGPVAMHVTQEVVLLVADVIDRKPGAGEMALLGAAVRGSLHGDRKRAVPASLGAAVVATLHRDRMGAVPALLRAAAVDRKEEMALQRAAVAMNATDRKGEVVLMDSAAGEGRATGSEAHREGIQTTPMAGRGANGVADVEAVGLLQEVVEIELCTVGNV